MPIALAVLEYEYFGNDSLFLSFSGVDFETIVVAEVVLEVGALDADHLVPYY